MRSFPALLLGASLTFGGVIPVWADSPEARRVGLDSAEARFGEGIPTGSGVRMGHVEGESGNYMPDTDLGQFRNISFVPRSGESSSFGHATQTARLAYGESGLAPGVRIVHTFDTNHWLGDGMLRTSQPAPPRQEELAVFSHSWIGDESPHTAEVLRRTDLLIDRDGVVVVAGVNNGRATRVPALLASAYNLIAVGNADGNSSGRYTQTEGDGRSKPDISAPGGRTSFATPVTAAMAARLVEGLRRWTEGERHPARAEVVKALLMAGATKPWNWGPEEGRPLDENLGAGVVNIDQSLLMLEAGPSTSGEEAGPHGWTAGQIESGQTDTFTWRVRGLVEESSVVLTWHRRIAGRVHIDREAGRVGLELAPRLPKLTLELHYIAPDGRAGVIARSDSEVDNVQKIHLRDAPPGEYRLQIHRAEDDYDEPWRYAAAWRAGRHVPYPGDEE